jgi:hypothetical protein
VILCVILTKTFAFFGDTRHGNVHKEPELIIDSAKSLPMKVIEDKWITQKLDNFNPFDTRTWQMRYFENTEYLQPGGPIIIFLGGEWEISPGRVTGGHLYDLAKEFNGSIYYTEHRYYGKSRPTEDLSVDNMRFLTIEQALEDVIKFIDFLKRTTPALKNSKVFVAGGSYSATMAVWIRQKYPHVIDAAWASSAPLDAKVDFKEYKEIMTQSIKIVGGEECLELFEEGFKEMERIIETGNYTKLEEDFNLCEPLQAPQDLPHFVYEVSDLVANLVQSHRPGRIEAGCKFLTNEKFTDPVEAIGTWVNIGSSECLDMSYENAVAKFSKIEYSPNIMRQWIYQTCSHFGWYQTSTSENQVFGTIYNVDYFIQICADFYDNIFTNEILEENVRNTNIVYGAYNPAVTQVYFTHGHLDPWRAVGLQVDLSERAPTTIIPLAAHVADMDSISEKDSEEMRASKERIRELFIDWLKL